VIDESFRTRKWQPATVSAYIRQFKKTQGAVQHLGENMTRLEMMMLNNFTTG
jgi:hypothetical protein